MNDAKNDQKFHFVALDIDDELHRKRSFALTTHLKKVPKISPRSSLVEDHYQ